LDHREEVLGKFVVSGGDAAEVFELAEEALDLVALAVERLAEARFPFAIGFGRDVGHCALRLDQIADVAGVIGFVGQHDGARFEAIQQAKRGRPVMRLACRQAQPDREALPVDDRVDFGRETAPGAAETMISTPLFAVAACWCARMEVLSIIWMSPS
jgi:hypothetical protein